MDEHSTAHVYILHRRAASTPFLSRSVALLHHIGVGMSKEGVVRRRLISWWIFGGWAVVAYTQVLDLGLRVRNDVRQGRSWLLLLLRSGFIEFSVAADEMYGVSSSIEQ